MGNREFIKVGDTVQYKGKTLICTEEMGCENCYFRTDEEDCFFTSNYFCSSVARQDGKSVVFKIKEEELTLSKQDIDLGTIITINNVNLKVIAQSGCIGCYFNERFSCTDIPYKCSGRTREDKVSIIFKKVDKTQKNKENRIEIPIGGVFIYKGETVTCKEHNLTLKCQECVFDHNEICDNLDCFENKRSDHKDVFFSINKVSIHPIGFVITLDGVNYKIAKYTSCHDCAFLNENCDENGYKCNAHERPDHNNIMYIEIPTYDKGVESQIEYCGEILKIVEYIDCSVCFFHNKGICNEINCNSLERSDNTSINFLRLYP